MPKFLKIAQLNEEQVAQIQGLERRLGKHVMAFEAGLQIAALSEEQLAKVNQLEQQLGVTLLVFDPNESQA